MKSVTPPGGRHQPRNSGARRSRKAAKPSWVSPVPTITLPSVFTALALEYVPSIITPRLCIPLMRSQRNARTPSGKKRLWGEVHEGPVSYVFGHNAIEKLQLHPFATGLDTGCVYGGELSAIELPSRKILRGASGEVGWGGRGHICFAHVWMSLSPWREGGKR